MGRPVPRAPRSRLDHRGARPPVGFDGCRPGTRLVSLPEWGKTLRGRETVILTPAIDRATRSPLREWAAASLILAMLAGGTALVYVTGGTTYSWAYLLFAPVLLGAAVFGLPGALLVALLAGLALGPFMPLDVARGLGQSTENWVARIAFFLGIGGFAGALFQRLSHETSARSAAARRDPRTGLANQVALEEVLTRAMDIARLTGRRVSIVLVRAADLFDALDAVGADAADEIVQVLGARIHAAAPNSEDVFRFSASELALVLTGVDDPSLEHYARRIRDMGEDALVIRDVPVRVELMIGIASAEHGREAPYELIRRARIALFAARERERDYCFYEPQHERRTADTIRLIARLREALEANEFELYYQPKMTLAGERVAGAEALIRWVDPEEGLVPPGRFMPKVEQTRLIEPLTHFVAREAWRFVSTHDQLGVSINLSPRSLYDESLMSLLQALVSSGEIEPGRLEIEVTETALMRQPDEAVKALRRFRSMGLGISIDDFGTGHSSFEYLRRFPVTGLKIDRVFIQDMESDARTLNLVRCMIDVAHGLDLLVTAEGVETDTACTLLRELGCDHVQGFHFSPALPGDEFLQWRAARAGHA